MLLYVITLENDVNNTGILQHLYRTKPAYADLIILNGSFLPFMSQKMAAGKGFKQQLVDYKKTGQNNISFPKRKENIQI